MGKLRTIAKKIPFSKKIGNKYKITTDLIAQRRIDGFNSPTKRKFFALLSKLIRKGFQPFRYKGQNFHQRASENKYYSKKDIIEGRIKLRK